MWAEASQSMSILNALPRLARMSAERSHPPATLRAVAELAGCSTATVSKALNGIHVSEANLARVFEAAEQLGYVPNMAARSIRGVSTMTIGILMNLDLHPSEDIMTTNNCMIAELERAGYSVFLSVAHGGPEQVDVLLKRFAERRVDGLFYWNATPSPSLSLYQVLGIPVLAIAFRDDECAELPLITVDGVPAFAAASKRLRSQGHRVFGEVAGSGPYLHDFVPTDKALKWKRFSVGFQLDSVRELVSSIAAAKRPPTVIWAHYPTALQILQVCQELGLDVPGDLSIVSITDTDAASLLQTPLSVIRTDYERLGHAAAQAMLAALDGKPLTDVIVSDAAEWIERDSTGPAREH